MPSPGTSLLTQNQLSPHHNEWASTHVGSANTAPTQNIYGKNDVGNGKCCACL